MATRRIDTQTLTDIGDAIRTKTGGSSAMTPAQMAVEIGNISEAVRLTWYQCPAAVKSYIESVQYSASDYSVSYIQSYAPDPPVPATNTKPIPLTYRGWNFYNEIPNKETPVMVSSVSPYWAGSVKPLDQVRWINSKTSNFRDLGGWACDGGTIRYGMLYRSGNLSAEDEDLLINKLGIKVECDLTADGVAAYPGKMRFIGHTSYAMYSLADTGAWQTNLRGIFDAVQYGDPVVFHCSMGADRTGTLACVLEGLLGVSQSDIDKDYELTSFYALRARNGNYQGGTADWAHLIAQIEALSGTTFRDKCVTFVKSLGFTVAEINTFRHAMIDGNPEDITVPTYTVTNTLTGCTTSNAATSANEGDAYSAVITANSGYSLSGATVQITIGGTDITSSAYNSGSIAIASVTGNIVIAIAAVEVPSYTNQIPISTDANGNVYNTTGYKEGYRLNSSGAETTYSGSVVTGFIPFVLGQEIVFNKFSGSESSNGGVYFYDSTHTLIASNKVNTLISDGILTAGQILDYTPTSPTHDSGSGNMKSIENVAYIRLSVFSSTPAALTCGILGEEPQPTNLFDPNDADVSLRGRINSSGNAVAYADNQLVTGFIPAADGDVFRIETDTSLKANNYTADVAYYDSGKTYKAQSTNAVTSVWTFSDSDMTGICTLSSTVSGVGYVRFCVAYTDINNIKIYKEVA